MAYVTNEKTAQVRNDLKAAFPAKAGWKFSVRKEHHTSVNVTILKAPIAWMNSYKADNPTLNGNALHIEGEGVRSCLISRYGAKNWFNEEVSGVLNQIIDIITVGHWDKSDSMTDYFHCAFYWNLNIGGYDQPCIYTGPAIEEEIEVFEEAAEIIEAAYQESNELSNETVNYILFGETVEGVTPDSVAYAEAAAMIAEASGDYSPEFIKDQVELNVPDAFSGTIWEGAKIISIYTRSEAIADGFLVDVSDMAKEAGIIYPVTVTKELWYDIAENIPESKSYQSEEGRLWDVLYMFAVRARNTPNGETSFDYQITMHVGRKANYFITAKIGPGDTLAPVVTLSKSKIQ